VRDAFVSGHAAADGEDENADDERPEIEFAPVTKGVVKVRRLPAFRDAEQHESAVARVNHGVNPLREHGGAARKEGGDKFCRGNRQIA